jgi:hypothetical protein
MKKLLSFLLLSTVLTITSFAADNIAKGASVKILEIAKSDSYYEERAELLGKEATALSELVKSSDGFYSGTLETTGGRTIFFTSVKVSAKSSTVSTKTSGTTSTTSKVKAPLFTGSTIPKGTRFVIIEVPSDDAYYSDREEIEGQTGTTSSEMTLEDGYTSGSLETDNGKSYYFYKVKLGKSTSTAPTKSSSTATTKTTTTAKTPKFITGTIKKGTTVYVAEISEDDSYYSDRFKMVGSKGKIGKNDLEMKENGWYSGDFSFDDGSTAYFYKVKFSKEPVDKLVKTADEETKSNNSDDDDWGYYFDDPTPTKDKTVSSGNDVSWEDASNDDNIKEGDNIKIIAVSPEDSYYDDRDEYEGKLGVAGDDLEYDSESGGYGGSVKLEDGSTPYFYLVKLIKIKSGSSTVKTSSTKSSSTIAKGTKVIVTDLSSDDSFYSDKSKYIRKKGKVAEGLNEQSNGFYSGKILFDDGTDAYFYKVKVNVLD